MARHRWLRPVAYLGIFHRNYYNAYGLADGVMESYRPFVDMIAGSIIDETSAVDKLTQPLKVKLLQLISIDVTLNEEKSPLTAAVQRADASLAKCYTGQQLKNSLYVDMKAQRLNAYHIMWVLVFFDLATETKKERKIYVDFRKKIMTVGFTMFRFSIYLRHCASTENEEVRIKRTKKLLPEKGHVSIMTVTDKQFGMVEIYSGKNPAETVNITE